MNDTPTPEPTATPSTVEPEASTEPVRHQRARRSADQAERVRIGRYYATESMLVWNEAQGRYDAEATPSFGRDTLRDFYARVLREGMAGQELGEHALFSKQK